MKPVAYNYSKLSNSQDELRVQIGTFNEIIYIWLKISLNIIISETLKKVIQKRKYPMPKTSKTTQQVYKRSANIANVFSFAWNTLLPSICWDPYSFSPPFSPLRRISLLRFLHINFFLDLECEAPQMSIRCEARGHGLLGPPLKPSLVIPSSICRELQPNLLPSFLRFF